MTKFLFVLSTEPYGDLLQEAHEPDIDTRGMVHLLYGSFVYTHVCTDSLPSLVYMVGIYIGTPASGIPNALFHALTNLAFVNQYCIPVA